MLCVRSAGGVYRGTRPSHALAVRDADEAAPRTQSRVIAARERASLDIYYYYYNGLFRAAKYFSQLPSLLPSTE